MSDPDASVYRIVYPFFREEFDDYDMATDQQVKAVRWRPGVMWEEGYDEPLGFCHGEGVMVLTMVAEFKPGRFPTRTFYTRTWIDPDGNALGKPVLRVVTREKFRRLVKGYHYAYDIEDSETLKRIADARKEAAQ